MLLCIDPSLTRTGWAVIDPTTRVESDFTVLEVGTIPTKPPTGPQKLRAADALAQRCGFIAKQLDSVLARHKIIGLIIELPHGGAQSAKAMSAMASVTGVCAAFASLKELPVEWTAPSWGKHAAAGSANASKEDVIDGVLAHADRCLELPASKVDREAICDAVAAFMAASKMGSVLVPLAKQLAKKNEPDPEVGPAGGTIRQAW